MSANAIPSTRPYLIRALYEWCSDSGLTPYIAVRVDDSVRVPREFVKNGEIVLNISMEATSGLKLGQEYLEFKSRFAGVARDVMIPLARVMAIYARENGQGMAFAMEDDAPIASPDGSATPPPPLSAAAATPVAAVAAPAASAPSKAGRKSKNEEDPDPPKPSTSGRPALKRVK